MAHLGGAGVEEGELNHLNYGDDERLIWVIESEPFTTISLNFSSFDLEEDFDFLWIYDGDNVFAPQLGRWNTQSPGMVTSSGNALCVEFRSDCATTAGGWRSQWTVLHDYTLDDEFNLEADDYEMAVFDVLGRAVPENQMRSGVYIVHYTRVSDGKTMVKRIIR